MVESFQTEIKTGQAGLDHPNVLKMLGAGHDKFTFDNSNIEDKMFIVSELAEHGELFDFIQETDGCNGDKTPFARALFGQIAQGIAYVHSKGIVHRDIKLENILIDNTVTAKIMDFGLMKFFAGPQG